MCDFAGGLSNASVAVGLLYQVVSQLRKLGSLVGSLRIDDLWREYLGESFALLSHAASRCDKYTRSGRALSQSAIGMSVRFALFLRMAV